MANPVLERLKIEPTPFIDDHRVTFVWKGKTAPKLVGDFTGWDTGEPLAMHKAGAGVWTYQLEFLSDAYIEYVFQKGEESILDPFNPRQTSNGIGGCNNYYSMPKYRASKLSKKKRRISHGTLKQYELSTEYLIAGRTRTVSLYQPPVNEPVPLVVVWDGQDYIHTMHLNYIVDNLINKEKIQPVALALVDNAGEELRNLEYACNDASLGFLMMQVLPLARKELNLMDTKAFPGVYGAVGASMGGLMALYTGMRLPQLFGRVLSQSGAFSFGNFDMAVYDLMQKDQIQSLQVYMDVGVYDLRGLLETNQRMQKLLSERGCRVIYREYHAGHNYPAWRDDIWRGLEALYPRNNPKHGTFKE
jgi:enterochelin esterase-like enzyme